MAVSFSWLKLIFPAGTSFALIEVKAGRHAWAGIVNELWTVNRRMAIFAER
ncbi:hypothetical protein Agau_C202177 [Agrobacterium tumefaciens F2]|nr:hypothetical protein Agau_C202177 [Agrobacterium tumefaciens F2]